VNLANDLSDRPAQPLSAAARRLQARQVDLAAAAMHERLPRPDEASEATGQRALTLTLEQVRHVA